MYGTDHTSRWCITTRSNFNEIYDYEHLKVNDENHALPDNPMTWNNTSFNGGSSTATFGFIVAESSSSSEAEQSSSGGGGGGGDIVSSYNVQGPPRWDYVGQYDLYSANDGYNNTPTYKLDGGDYYLYRFCDDNPDIIAWIISSSYQPAYANAGYPPGTQDTNSSTDNTPPMTGWSSGELTVVPIS